MSFRFVHNQRIEGWRLSVVVSKKTEPSAVGRNRIRRRIYSILRDELDSKGFNQLDLAVINFDNFAKECSHEDLSQEIDSLVKQLTIKLSHRTV